MSRENMKSKESNYLIFISGLYFIVFIAIPLILNEGYTNSDIWIAVFMQSVLIYGFIKGQNASRLIMIAFSTVSLFLLFVLFPITWLLLLGAVFLFALIILLIYSKKLTGNFPDKKTEKAE